MGDFAMRCSNIAKRWKFTLLGWLGLGWPKSCWLGLCWLALGWLLGSPAGTASAGIMVLQESVPTVGLENATTTTISLVTENPDEIIFGVRAQFDGELVQDSNVPLSSTPFFYDNSCSGVCGADSHFLFENEAFSPPPLGVKDDESILNASMTALPRIVGSDALVIPLAQVVQLDAHLETAKQASYKIHVDVRSPTGQPLFDPVLVGWIGSPPADLEVTYDRWNYSKHAPGANDPEPIPPVTEIPKAEEETATIPAEPPETTPQQPRVEEPIYEEPNYEEPVYETPIHEPPIIEEPRADASGTDEPVSETPVSEVPVAEEPDGQPAEEPIQEPIVLRAAMPTTSRTIDVGPSGTPIYNVLNIVPDTTQTIEEMATLPLTETIDDAIIEDMIVTAVGTPAELISTVFTRSNVLYDVAADSDAISSYADGNASLFARNEVPEPGTSMLTCWLLCGGIYWATKRGRHGVLRG